MPHKKNAPPPLHWPDPREMPTFGSDYVAASACGKHITAFRRAVLTGLIPDSAYAMSETHRRVYRQADLRRLFGLPAEGEVTLSVPLW